MSDRTIPTGLRGKGVPMHVSMRLGVCHYCGRIDLMTIDHVVPKRLRLNRHDGTATSPKVYACVNCNQMKGDKAYEDFRNWLLTEDGYWYLWFRHNRDLSVQPCEVLPMEDFTTFHYVQAEERERHYCGHKPCGVLRQRIVVIGDGRSVWSNERLTGKGKWSERSGPKFGV